MHKFKIVAVLSLIALAACQPRYSQQLGTDGQPLPVAYTISPRDTAEIPLRVLQQINTLRANVAAPPLTLDPQLTAAALQHSRDMAAQNRAWHWGSDGSSPLDRARNQGYAGKLIGENISESYENEIQTLSAWMQERDTRDIIMDPSATTFGIAWYQEPSNKIWWTLLAGGY